MKTKQTGDVAWDITISINVIGFITLDWGDKPLLPFNVASVELSKISGPQEISLDLNHLMKLYPGTKFMVQMSGVADSPYFRPAVLPSAANFHRAPVSGAHTLVAADSEWNYKLDYTFTPLRNRMMIVKRNRIVDVLPKAVREKLQDKGEQNMLIESLEYLKMYGVTFRQLDGDDVILEGPTDFEDLIGKITPDKSG
jgi:hypothetical protein